MPAHQLTEADLIKNGTLRSQKTHFLGKPTGAPPSQVGNIFIRTQEGSLVDVCFKHFQLINIVPERAI